MTCGEFHAVATDLARGRVERPEVCEQAAIHARQCRACADGLADEQAVTRALGHLRAATIEEAPPWLELALRAAFARQTRQQRCVTVRRPLWYWSTAASAAGIVLGIFGLSWLGSDRPAAPISVEKPLAVEKHSEAAAGLVASPSRPAAPGQPRERTIGAGVLSTQPRSAGSRGRPGPKSREPALARGKPRELVTEFVWLPYGAPSGFETAQIVRVRLPRAVLPSFGLAMDGRDLGDRVQADVIVGEDGLARAIRLVHTPSTGGPFE